MQIGRHIVSVVAHLRTLDIKRPDPCLYTALWPATMPQSELLPAWKELSG